MSDSANGIPLACSMNAFDDGQRLRYAAIRLEMGTLIRGVDELENGYTLRFDADGSLFLLLAEFVTLEHVCCPFLQFRLEVGWQEALILLTLMGGDGVKAFLREELGQKS